MKKRIQSLCVMMAFGTSILFAQNRTAPTAISLQDDLERSSKAVSNFENNDASRSVACANDTVWYGYEKNIGTTVKGFGYSDGGAPEGGGQYFDAPQQITVHGFTFYGRTTAAGALTNVTASIYLANATDSLPTGLPLASQSIAMDYQTTLGAMRRVVNFSLPVTVNGAYILTIDNPTATTVGLYNTYWNTAGDSLSGRGEQLNLIYTDANNWQKWDDLGPNYDFDYLIQPIVSYDIVADFTPSATQVCEGTSINFVNNPSPILSSRFYNYGAFLNYFEAQSNDYHYWDMADLTVIENQGASFNHTYATSGSYDVYLASYLSRWGTGICYDETNAIITVDPTVVPVVSIALTSGTNPACSGDALTFTATPTNGGSAPTYEWFIGATSTGAASLANTFSTSALNNGDVVTCVMVSNSTVNCISTAPVTSNAITMVVNANVTPAVSIALTNGNNPTCPGGELTYTATPVNGGTTPTYQWYINGVLEVGATNSTYTSSSFSDQDVLHVVMTSNETCVTSATGTSNSETITVDPTLTLVPSVSITGNNSICAGTSVTFTATPTNGGSAPTYEWFVGTTSSGTGSSFTSSTLNNGDVVSVELTSSLACASPTNATSNTITMTVNPVVTPAVAIAESANNVCDGTAVTYTATPTNGGTSATYEWNVNGAVNVSSTTDMLTITPADGDVVYVTMTSSDACANPATATSNTITMTTMPVVVPSVAVAASANPICAGDAVTFTATPTNGGTAPVYQWKINGTNAGTNNAVFTSAAAGVVNGDVVSCEMTSSANCASPVSSTDAVTISEKTAANASFTSTVAAGVVDFDASASVGAGTLTYSWDFGDGSAAGSGVTTSHTYATNDNYTVVLTITDECTSVTKTETVSVVSLSINNQTANNTVTVYPNPSNGIINVNTSENATVVIYNAIGSLISTSTTNNNKVTIDLNKEANGIYFVKVLTNKETVVRKVNISR